LDSVFLSFLRWGKNFPLFGELLLTTTQTQEVTEYDEQLVRRLIEKITVYDEWVTVEFKSGTSVKVRR